MHGSFTPPPCSLLSLAIQADKYGVPRMCFVNKMDRTGANFYRAVDMIKASGTLSSPLLPCCPDFLPSVAVVIRDGHEVALFVPAARDSRAWLPSTVGIRYILLELLSLLCCVESAPSSIPSNVCRRSRFQTPHCS